MSKFVKVILFLLLAITIHCVADNLFADKSVKDVTFAHASEVNITKVSKPDFPFLPEGELASATQTFQVVTSRILRTGLQEYSSTLRLLVQHLLLREAVLTQHFGKIYDTTVSYNCSPASQYYVYTLRRIII